MKTLKINLMHWSLIFLALTAQTIKPEMVLDETFGAGGIVRGEESWFRALIQSNEKLIVISYSRGNESFKCTCYNQNGLKDESFKSYVQQGNNIGAFVLQENAHFITAVNTCQYRMSDVNLYRFNLNGSFDESFRNELKEGVSVSAIVVLQDGSFIAAGSTYKRGTEFRYLSRYNRDGSFDKYFVEPKNIGAFSSLLLQPDDKILAAGHSELGSIITRYNSDGRPDESFGDKGQYVGPFQGSYNSLAIQSNGKIITVAYNHENHHIISCLNQNGSLDRSFGSDENGFVNKGGWFRDLTLQPNGKILILADYHSMPSRCSMLSCYNSNGTDDTTFGSHGANTLELPQNFHGLRFLFNSDTQTVTIAGFERLPNGTEQSMLIRYRTLTPAEAEERRVAQEAARIEAEMRDLMRVELLENCQICLEEVAIQNLIETECHHLFHPACMNVWRTSGAAAANTCPVCRGVLPN